MFVTLQHPVRPRTYFAIDQSDHAACQWCEVTTVCSRPDKMGFEKVIIKEGSGSNPVKGKNVTVHCTGYGKNGDMSLKFWSTKDPGQEPFTFRIGMGQVIKGWDEGVLTMKLGEVSRITCTPDYAYGADGFPSWGIMANSSLIFEIEFALWNSNDQLIYITNSEKLRLYVDEDNSLEIPKCRAVVWSGFGTADL
eukprot:gene1990-3870_t